MSYLIPGCTQPLPGKSPYDTVYFLLGNTRTLTYSSAQVYMQHFAVSFHDMSGGLLLTTSSPDAFIADLVAYGWLVEWPLKEE